MIQSIQESGTLLSFFPADLSIAMVAPNDLGRVPTQRLVSATDDVGIEHFEGPERYTANDVAAAFAKVMGRDVRVEDVQREALVETFRSFGFSNEAAASYACMTRRTIDGKTDTADRPFRGTVSLESYVVSILVCAV